MTNKELEKAINEAWESIAELTHPEAKRAFTIGFLKGRSLGVNQVMDSLDRKFGVATKAKKAQVGDSQ